MSHVCWAVRDWKEDRGAEERGERPRNHHTPLRRDPSLTRAQLGEGSREAGGMPAERVRKSRENQTVRGFDPCDELCPQQPVPRLHLYVRRGKALGPNR